MSTTGPQIFIGSFEAIFEGMFGPLQHDAHVLTRKRHLGRPASIAASKRADEYLRSPASRLFILQLAHGHDVGQRRFDAERAAMAQAAE